MITKKSSNELLKYGISFVAPQLQIPLTKIIAINKKVDESSHADDFKNGFS